ncbi:MAG: nicotinate (nicotinamide) nucleotide adenylyltransferase [Planctomycetota bacterium]|nr:MAG: nicotinate (nicotinamide) nucleotide adenylyltransferase [Planctomycetota bacterium]
MRVGILGGSFNPVHNGHLYVAREVLERASLDIVYLVPSYRAPHKEQPFLLPADFRLELARKAVSSLEGVEVLDIEIRRGGYSYTVDTLEQLWGECSFHRYFFIIGVDMLGGLHRWKRIDRIFQLCEFIPVQRGRTVVRWSDLLLPLEWVEVLRRNFLAISSPEVSSTEIRRRLLEGESIAGLVPEGLEEELEEQGRRYFLASRVQGEE